MDGWKTFGKCERMKVELRKAQVHPTNRCNLKCIFCDVPVRYKGCKDLDERKWKKIVDDLCDLHPQIVTISGGGEPLLRPTLVSYMIKKFSAYGIASEIITNGVLLSDELAKDVAECVELYRISLHSISLRLDKILRGVQGSITKTLEGTRKIDRWKKKMKIDKPKIDVAMVITKFNVYEIEKMIKKAKDYGINKVSLRIVHKWGEEYKPSELQMEYLKGKLNYFKLLAEKNGIEFSQDFLPEEVFNEKREKTQDKKNDVFCTLPFAELVVFADGRVAPCCNFIIDSKDTMGVDLIDEKKSLKEIWLGEKFNLFRKIMEKNKIEKLPATCRICSIDLKPIDKRYRTFT